MTRRARILSFGSAVLLVVAGIVGAVAFSGTLGQVLALVLIGLGCVLATALVFLEVGLSEDRERAQAASQAKARPLPPSRPSLSAERPARPRLERMRGRRRRLR